MKKRNMLCFLMIAALSAGMATGCSAKKEKETEKTVMTEAPTPTKAPTATKAPTPVEEKESETARETETEKVTEQQTEPIAPGDYESMSFTATEAVNVRSEASMDAEVMDCFYAGDKVHVLGENGDGWYKVRIDYPGNENGAPFSIEGYVKKEYIQQEESQKVNGTGSNTKPVTAAEQIATDKERGILKESESETEKVQSIKEMMDAEGTQN